MPRKIKEKSKKSGKIGHKEAKADIDALTTDVLHANAGQCMQKGNYREAIDLFKALLRREDKPQWKEHLCQAYHGRVKELVDKGMCREALVTVDHLKSLCKAGVEPSLYLRALAGAGKTVKAADYFLCLKDGGGKFSRPKSGLQERSGDTGDAVMELPKEMESIMACLLLSLDDKEAGQLAEVSSHPFLLLREVVLQAVHALAKGDDDRCKVLLAQIPFTSAYKDFRLFLRGLLSFYGQDWSDALECFRKMPGHSCLKHISERLVWLLEHKTADKGTLSVSSLSCQDRRFILSLQGKDERFIDEMEQISEAFLRKDYRRLITLLGKYSGLGKHIDLDKHHSLFDKKTLVRFCTALLIKTTSISEVYSRFIAPLNLFDINRVVALHYELASDYIAANHHWKECLKNIDVYMAGTEEEKRLASAYIHRRIARNINRYPQYDDLDDMMNLADELFGGRDADDPDDEEKDPFDGNGPIGRDTPINHLEASVELDPGHRETYNQIISHYKVLKDKKKAALWADILVANFPEDIAGLLEASNLAMKRNALKTAITYLDRIVSFDPINKEARHKKKEIHVIKAGKHFNERKYHLARKEFAAAVALNREGEKDGRLLITWAIMEMRAGNEKEGAALLEDGTREAGNGMLASFLTLIEAELHHLSNSFIKGLIKTLNTYLNTPVRREELASLLKVAMEYRELKEARIRLKHSLNFVLDYIEKARTYISDEASFLLICLYLSRNFAYPLLKDYANEALTHHADNYKLIYYYLEALLSISSRKFTYNDLERARFALQEARDKGDTDTAKQLHVFINIIQAGLPAQRGYLPAKRKKTKQDRLF